MPQKLGNGGHSQENYDPETGRYVKEEDSSQSNDGRILGFNHKAGYTKSDAPTGGRGNSRLKVKINESSRGKLKLRQQASKQDDYLTKDIKKKDREYTFLEDVMAVNPNHNSRSKGNFDENCQRCAPTLVARLCWGYDVTANSIVEDKSDFGREIALNNYRLDDLYSVYEGANPVYHPGRKGVRYRQESWKELDDYMDTLPEKAVVQVSVEGHTFVVVRKNGRNICVEPQCPEYYMGKSEKEADDYVDKNHRERFTIDSYCRVDNLKPSRRFWDTCVNVK